jgi:hypothetical protein
MKLVYEGNWTKYEEWGCIRVFEDSDECYYVQYGGHSVYSSEEDPDWADWEEPYIVSFATVLELIDEWDQIEKENDEYWENNG